MRERITLQAKTEHKVHKKFLWSFPEFSNELHSSFLMEKTSRVLEETFDKNRS